MSTNNKPHTGDKIRRDRKTGKLLSDPGYQRDQRQLMLQVAADDAAKREAQRVEIKISKEKMEMGYTAARDVLRCVAAAGDTGTPNVPQHLIPAALELVPMGYLSSGALLLADGGRVFRITEDGRRWLAELETMDLGHFEAQTGDSPRVKV
jgi:hypothetical protein